MLKILGELSREVGILPMCTKVLWASYMYAFHYSSSSTHSILCILSLYLCDLIFLLFAVMMVPVQVFQHWLLIRLGNSSNKKWIVQFLVTQDCIKLLIRWTTKTVDNCCWLNGSCIANSAAIRYWHFEVYFEGMTVNLSKMKNTKASWTDRWCRRCSLWWLDCHMNPIMWKYILAVQIYATWCMQHTYVVGTDDNMNMSQYYKRKMYWPLNRCKQELSAKLYKQNGEEFLSHSVFVSM